MTNYDVPLGDLFDQNPLYYLQTYVRSMNNYVFLSYFQINNLYALLLIGRIAPWDSIQYLILLDRSNSPTSKYQMDEVVTKKIHDVKNVLEALSQVYYSKAKKSSINQIERLMRIIKSPMKSIFIYKNKEGETRDKVANMVVTGENNDNNYQQREDKIKKEVKGEELVEQNSYHHYEHTESFGREYAINSPFAVNTSNNMNSEQPTEPDTTVQSPTEYKPISDSQYVFSLFYGLANLPNISAKAMGNFLDYNPTYRSITFRMSSNYIMSIRNDYPFFYDRTSLLHPLPSYTLIQHIFPYLTANYLFNSRAVCKYWSYHVKYSWHATFKRYMFIQLLACEFCKDIEFYYKMIQLRNPFFQKLSLLIHALVEIVQWDNLILAITNNTISLQMKRVVIIILKLTGYNIQITNLSTINYEMFNRYKQKCLNLKATLVTFLNNLGGANLSVDYLRAIKTGLLDDPFMRVYYINSYDKTPLLLMIFVKQLTLQQILRNNIFFAQEYLLNVKRRLDNLSAKMPSQKNYLETVYKILLLRAPVTKEDNDSYTSEMPDFQDLLRSILSNSHREYPDFVIKGKMSRTNIYLDYATKLDILMSTVRTATSRMENQEIIIGEHRVNEGSNTNEIPKYIKNIDMTNEEISQQDITNNTITPISSQTYSSTTYVKPTQNSKTNYHSTTDTSSLQ